MSAIDFVVAEQSVEKDLDSRKIDEKGLLKITGRKYTDHNTIKVNLKMKKVKKQKQENHTVWRLNAPEEKWSKFRIETEQIRC